MPQPASGWHFHPPICWNYRPGLRFGEVQARGHVELVEKGPGTLREIRLRQELEYNSKYLLRMALGKGSNYFLSRLPKNPLGLVEIRIRWGFMSANHLLKWFLIELHGHFTLAGLYLTTQIRLPSVELSLPLSKEVEACVQGCNGMQRLCTGCVAGNEPKLKGECKIGFIWGCRF